MRTECRVVMSRAQGGLSALDRALSCDCVYVCPVSRHSAGASYFSIVLCYIVSLGKSGRRTAVPPRRCAAGKRAAELLSPLQPSPLPDLPPACSTTGHQRSGLLSRAPVSAGQRAARRGATTWAAPRL